MSEHDESKLPLWAQERLAEARRNLERVNGELERVRSAHALLQDGKTWFTLPGPSFASDKEYVRLWRLEADDAMPVCSLGRGDVLLVGRAAKET